MENLEEEKREEQGAAEGEARPVKMRWGRVVDDGTPSEAEKPAEEKPAPPPKARPLRFPVEEIVGSERAEGVPSEGDPISTVPPAPVSAPKPERKGPERRETQEDLAGRRAEAERIRLRRMQEQRAAERAAKEREIAERERRMRYAEERHRREEETERLRQELEQENLRRKIARRRRRRAFSAGVAGVFSLIFGLFTRIRVSKRAVLTLLSTALVTVLLAAVVGNLLRARLPDAEEETTTDEPPQETIAYGRDFLVPAVNAATVSLEGATAASLKSEAKRFRETGIDAVSLLLRRDDGTLLFRSLTESGIFGSAEDEAETPLLSLGEILRPFRDAGLYVSCLFPMRYTVDGDGYTREVLRAYETALLLEIAEAGADEVVLSESDLLFNLREENAVPNRLATLRETVAAVNLRAPETAVGIALSPEFLATSESDRYLGEIAETFDFTLIDLCGIKNSELDLVSAVSSAVTEHLYFILRYGMRVLIPYGTAEGVVNREVYNWQEGTIGER